MQDFNNSTDLDDLLTHSDWLHGLARRIVRDTDTADDVVQETFIAALERGFPKGTRASGEAKSEEARLRSWLGTVASNFARRRQRSRSIRRHHEEIAATSRQEATQPQDTLELKQMRKEMASLVLQLQEPFRTAILLRYQAGLPYRNVARRLQISTPAARKRVSRGLALLRIEANGPGLSDDENSLPNRAVFILAGRSTEDMGPPSVPGKMLSTKSIWIAATTAIVITGWIGYRSLSQPSATLSASHDENIVAADPDSRPTGKAQDAESNRVAIQESFAAGKPDEIDITQSPAKDQHLQGRVTNSKGQPIEGATVRILRDTAREHGVVFATSVPSLQVLARGQTASDGEFSFEMLPGKPVDIEVSKLGHALSLHPNAYAGDFVEVQLNAPAAFAGQVLRQDGSGVSRAKVRVHMQEGLWGVLETDTDETGAFLLEGLQAGRIRVQVLPEKEIPLAHIEEILVSGQTKHRNFLVRPGFRIRGQVVEAQSGNPIEGAEVDFGGRGWKKTQTDSRGRYEVNGLNPAFAPRAQARASGYGREMVDLRQYQERATVVNFTLSPAGSVSGRLISEQGIPVPGAFVASISDYINWPSSESDSEGYFHIEDLQPKMDHCLLVIAEGFGTCAFELPRIPQLTRELVLDDVTLRPSALLSGRLLNLNGEPLECTAVYLQPTYDDRFALSGPLSSTPGLTWLGAREGQVGQSGRFSFGDLAPGSYRLVIGINSPGAIRSEPIYIPVGAQIANLDIVFDAGLEIRGRVINELGDPVHNVAVTILPEQPNSFPMGQMFSDANGFFSGQNYTPGTYRIEAHPYQSGDPNSRPVSQTAIDGVNPAGKELRIVMPLKD